MVLVLVHTDVESEKTAGEKARARKGGNGYVHVLYRSLVLYYGMVCRT